MLICSKYRSLDRFLKFALDVLRLILLIEVNRFGYFSVEFSLSQIELFALLLTLVFLYEFSLVSEFTELYTALDSFLGRVFGEH